MKTKLIFGALLISQISTVNGMDQTSPQQIEQALLAKVSEDEIHTRVSSAAVKYQMDRFGMYNARGEMIDLHNTTVELDKDIYVKEQLIPCLIAERVVMAKEMSVVVSADKLSQEITKNVLAVWNEQKNTRKK